MSRLAPDLFERRFGDLMQIGRARLPSLAPSWTDHNAHDPGITLMELLAWVGEAQLYSLARVRRDERRAYAALTGIKPNGARPASGLIWPDHDDPDAPARMIARAMVIEPDWPVQLTKTETPAFRPARRMLWLPTKVESLTACLGDGTVSDHTMANRRGGPAFQPFGEGDGRDAVLRMRLVRTGLSPLFDAGRPADAWLVVGVRADAPRAGGAIPRVAGPSPLAVRLVTDDGAFPLRIVEDGTQGLLRTGVCVLDLAGVEGAPDAATLEFHAPGGFDRPPRLLRIEPNVLPVVQRLEVSERHLGNGLPDQGFDLETPGLEFEPGTAPVTIKIERPGGTESWEQRERLADCGPGDHVFSLDPVAARISFGNGVNGAIPPAETPIVASYWVNAGSGGNLAANRKWAVKGFAGAFGVNPDPFADGEDPSGWLEQRREARRAIREDHALISAADFEAAARALPGLEVGRAWMMPPSAGDAATGTMRLVVMQARPRGREPETILETARWLEAVRRALAPRTPLGARLDVAAPLYAGFTIEARIEPEPKRDPARVREQVEAALSKRLTLVSPGPGQPQRPFGLAVGRRDLAAWIQALPDVRRVTGLTIRLADGTAKNEVALAKRGLPRLDLGRSRIEVVRAGGGAP